MFPQHERALEKAKIRLLSQGGVSTILIGGSIAKKRERPDSDVDLIVVVADEEYARRLSSHQVMFVFEDVADYPKGYVEGRYISRSFVFAAAERGSEPTRSSFTGVVPVYSTDPEILEVLPLIPVYQEAERERKMLSFFALVMVNRWLYGGPSPENPTAALHMAAMIGHFGARLILAHNRKLYPCRRRLWETFVACPEKPPGIVELAKTFLMRLTRDSKEEYCKAIQDYFPWPPGLAPFEMLMEDVEMSWYNRTIDVGEW